jgi:uncharacterized membrane protein YwaF
VQTKNTPKKGDFMPAVVFGIEHFLYIGITTFLSVLGLLLAKKYAKTEKSKTIIIKALALALLVSILLNRLSQVFRYGLVRWEQIIPDSYCGMTSLVLSLAVLFGKKDNCVLHFTWILAIFGGISTVIYPAFIGQGPTVFYLPPFRDFFTIAFPLSWVLPFYSLVGCALPIKNGTVLYSALPAI